MPGIVNDSLRADHSRLNKFNRRSPEYRNILRRLEDIIDRSLEVPITHECCTIPLKQARPDLNFNVDYEPIMEVVDELIGRENDLRLIESHLERKESKGPVIVTLHGLGGIGKTQLASAYFNKSAQSYSARFRLDGSNRPNFESDFLHIAKIAGLNGASAALSETPTERVWDWLNLKGNNEWLILLDNVDDPGDSAEQFDISNFLKNLRQGSVIITTRLQHLSWKSKRVPVGRLESVDALSVLKRHARRDVLEGELTKYCSVGDLTWIFRLQLHQIARGIGRTSTCSSSFWYIYVPNGGVSLIVFGSLQRDVANTYQTPGPSRKLPRQDS